MEGRRWCMHPREVAVLDANAAALGVAESDLMAAAGQALAARALAMLGEAGRPRGPVWIFCGPGNNGGDGFAAALALQEEGVDVRLLASHLVQKGDGAQAFRDRCVPPHLSTSVWPERASLEGSGRPALILDCLLGAGARPGQALRGDVGAMRHWLDESRGAAQPVLACDIPTGFGGPDVLPASETVTFHAEKFGMRRRVGPVNWAVAPEVGRLHLARLPWPEAVMNVGPGDAIRYPPLDPDARKGDRGRLLIIGGGPYHGAPLLAGMAAARVGCDLVHVAMPSEARERAKWPATLIPEPIPDTAELTVASHEALTGRMLSGRGAQAVLIGPGLGKSDATLTATRRLIDACIEADIPVVLDADAIAALPSRKWPQGLRGVVTPHASEMASWLGDVDPVTILGMRAGRESIEDDREDESICIVCTGPVDDLWAPGGRRAQAHGGHPRMATGGTGDLLAGAIAGLLAAGMQPWPAARLGCALLREAGALAGGRLGAGLTAEDVPPLIAEVLNGWAAPPKIED